MSDHVRKIAQISACGQYRYSLRREWDDDLPLMTWIMLNPSTADAEKDDPTIRRCMAFARREGCGAIEVVNLAAFRATAPADMMRAPDPFGPENMIYVPAAIFSAHIVVAAWGVHGEVLLRRNAGAAAILPLLKGARCLAKTNSGAPRHPLYVPASQPFVPWKRDGKA